MKTIEDAFKDSKERDKHNELPRNVFFIRGGRTTGTGTNRQGAANPRVFEYNKRSEAIRGLARLNEILVNHDLRLPFVGRGKRAADEELLFRFAFESEAAEAIARAVCDYVVDHPDDSMVADEVKRAYGNNETLLRDQCNGNVGDDVVLGLGCRYWRCLANVEIELQKALRWNQLTPAANSQAETTPQTQGNKPQQVPSWATTEVAKGAFAKAVERGYMSPSAYGYKWKESTSLLAYFVERLSKKDMLTPYPDKEACSYFHTKNLRQIRQYYLNIDGGKPKNFDKIDALFE